jgi:hypothetical protein
MGIAIAGAYRINSVDFPAPESTSWEEQPIASGLNGITIDSSYVIHRWNWAMLDGETAQNLFTLVDLQQDGNAQLTSVETDPYDASGATEVYGTTVYTDFVIKEMSPRTRGLPNYDDVTVIFEIYVP